MPVLSGCSVGNGQTMVEFFFLADYPTHAQMWHVVPSTNTIENPLNQQYYVRDRYGSVYYVWHDMFATYADMERKYLLDVEVVGQIGNTYETHVLSA